MLNNNSPASTKRPLVIFLCRTKKKKAYFNLLKDRLLSGFDCQVDSYYELPKSKVNRIPEDRLNDIVNKMEDEFFNGKNSRWSFLKSYARYVSAILIKIIYSRLYALISSTQPSIVCLWNGQKWQDNIFHAVNMDFNISVAYFENGVLPGSTTLDFCGINARNCVPRNALFYSHYGDMSKSLGTKIAARKYRVNKKSTCPVAMPKKYILVPFQKDRDTQILDNSTWIKSMEQLFYTIVDALELSQRSDLHVVFRGHPSERDQYKALQKLADSHERLCFDQQSDLVEIIEGADCVVTVNSTVGLESLILGSKVIVLGDAFYAIDSLVKTASSTSELVNCLDAIAEFTPNITLRNRFINYLETEYIIEGDWLHPSDSHCESVRLRLQDKLFAVLEGSGDEMHALKA